MKKLIAIIYILLFAVAFISCEDNKDMIVNDVTVGFVKSKLDVGENTEILDIPVVVTGARADVKLNLVANITALDGTAIKDVDYQLIDNSVALSSAGKHIVQVKILDNKTMLPSAGTKDKSFTISIASVEGDAKVKISEVEVFIVSDEIFITPTIAFLETELDVYKNIRDGILEIPIFVSGVRADVVLDLVANITAKAGTALENVHYELETKSFAISKIGKYVVKVKIIDYVFMENLNFTVSASVVGNANITVSEVKATILDDGPILIWSENFDNDAEDWFKFDLDDDGVSWKIRTFSGNVYDNKCAISESYQPETEAQYKPDNIFTGPAVDLTTGTYILSWNDGTRSSKYPGDKITVYRTAVYDNLEDYVEIYDGVTSFHTDIWTARQARFTLTQNATIHIAFRHRDPAGDFWEVLIDDVELRKELIP